jgi:glutamate decarboxylase
MSRTVRIESSAGKAPLVQAAGRLLGRELTERGGVSILTSGPFEVLYDGNMDAGIPALCWKLKDGIEPGFSLYDLADRLRSRGWQVPAYSLPANVQDLVIQRILVRHGVSRDLGALLLDDMKRAIEYFKQHPIQTHLSAEEASGFHH